MKYRLKLTPVFAQHADHWTAAYEAVDMVGRGDTKQAALDALVSEFSDAIHRDGYLDALAARIDDGTLTEGSSIADEDADALMSAMLG